MNRREFLPLAGAGLLSGFAGWKGGRKEARRPRPGRAAVAVVKAAGYTEDLASLVRGGIEACGIEVHGKSILLKPQLAAFDPGGCINTHAAAVAAAFEALLQMGAAQVLIGAGPGHRRDACALAEAAYRTAVPGFDDLFVDLNTDDVSAVQGFAGRGPVYLPNTALRADLVVSMAKMKTDHQAGASLSLKNLSGLLPGSVYGWPKSDPYQIGASASILELARLFRRSFAIVDGVVGMQGEGPMDGTARPARAIVIGSDLLAVDATCCRIMGIDPGQIEYLREDADRLGVTAADQIDQRGEDPADLRTDFDLPAQFGHLRLT